jgi:flagellar hook protein FlgE
MPNAQSIVQSLNTVDRWVDMINADINGTVRTGQKSARLSFSGSGSDNALQIAEQSLIGGHSVIDFGQGAVIGSTENTHIAIQGDGFFTVVDPSSVNTTTGAVAITGTSNVLLTRDGEFRTNQAGLLVNASGYYLVAADVQTTPGSFAPANFRTVYNDADIGSDAAAPMTNAVNFTDFISNSLTAGTLMANGTSTLGGANYSSLVKVAQGAQSLEYADTGSTQFDLGFGATGATAPEIRVVAGTNADATILSKSLEASNASMTQSVPELASSSKLFQALTRVLQTTNTNVDALLGVIK